MRRLLSTCPAERTLKLLEGRWKIFIIHHLFQGELRHAELRRAVESSAGPISQKVLTQELRDLERDELVLRTALEVKAPVVSYRLTGIAQRLQPILESMVLWGYEYERGRSGTVEQPHCLLGDTHIQAY